MVFYFYVKEDHRKLKWSGLHLWHDGCIHFCGCEWVPVRVFFYLFWCETHKKGLRARFPVRLEEDKGRQGLRAVYRSRGKVTAKWGVGTCGLRSQVSQRERMRQRSWWLCRNFARTHACNSQMHRIPYKSVTNFSLLALGANPSPCLLFFSFTLSVVYVVLCVCKAMWNALGKRWEKPLDDWMAMNWFRRLI